MLLIKAGVPAKVVWDALEVHALIEMETRDAGCGSEEVVGGALNTHGNPVDTCAWSGCSARAIGSRWVSKTEPSNHCGTVANGGPG